MTAGIFLVVAKDLSFGTGNGCVRMGLGSVKKYSMINQIFVYVITVQTMIIITCQSPLSPVYHTVGTYGFSSDLAANGLY